MTPEAALRELEALAEPQKAGEMAAYHKVDRPYLGVSNPQIDGLCKAWRQGADVAQRVEIASFLWGSNIYEARVAAAKLLTQARIKEDRAVWDLICAWVPEFDSWAIADHACSAGSRRLVADPQRLDIVEKWTTDENLWVRRAALVMTLPWSKMPNPKPHEIAARERMLGWAAEFTADNQWFIQKSVSWWLRSLGKHDPDRVRVFMTDHGGKMKPFAQKDAVRNLPN